MSINSKIRREAKKRSASKKVQGTPPVALPIEPHAELRDAHGQLLAGIVRRDGEWVLGLGGKIAGNSDSAAHVLAMIQRAAVLHEKSGTPVRLTFSDTLREAAHAEVAGMGISYEAFAAALDASMQGDAGESAKD